MACAIGVPAGGPPAIGGIVSESWQDANAGRLVIEFEGGVLVEEIATVLTRFAESPDLIPSRVAMVAPEDRDACLLLARTLSLPRVYCSEQAFEAIRTFSMVKGKILPPGTMLRPGDALVVPDILAEPFVFHRTFDLTREKQKSEFQGVTTNPAWKDLMRQAPEPVEKGAALAKLPSRTLEFDGLRWRVLITNRAALPAAEVLAFDLNRPNVSVYLERAALHRAIPLKKYSSPTDMLPNAYYDRCRFLGDMTNLKAAYRKYFLDREAGIETAYQCQPQSGTAPEVYVIDSKVAPHPDIPLRQRAIAMTPAPVGARVLACRTPAQWNRDNHHGTYLAGIVSSGGKMEGFVGLSPEAIIDNILWERNAQDQYLVDQLRGVHTAARPQIFLFASEFNGIAELVRNNTALMDRVWNKARDQEGREIYNTTELKNKDLRYEQIPINKVIINSLRPIIVVSAGQKESGGVELGPKSPAAPQNIGDANNVIVVTACSDCSTGAAKLWDQANYSATGAHLVDLAAPGGQPIPGLLDASSIGMPDHGGTSAAAAFTASVLANMLACHPAYYLRRPSLVKEQLLVTARANMQPADRHKVPGGTIDPHLASINPEKTWLRVAGRPGMVEIKRFSHWCRDSLALRNENGNDDGVALRQVRRVTEDNGSYAMRQLSEDDVRFSTVLRLDVKGPAPVDTDTKDAPLAAVEIEGKGACKLRLLDIQDLIIQSGIEGRKTVATCRTTLKLCYE